jgi:hypothetical protein
MEPASVYPKMLVTYQLQRIVLFVTLQPVLDAAPTGFALRSWGRHSVMQELLRELAVPVTKDNIPVWYRSIQLSTFRKHSGMHVMHVMTMPLQK